MKIKKQKNRRKIKMSAAYVIIGIIVGIILLYLLAIMPRMGNRPSKEFLMNHYYAHRGFHDNGGDAPENSLKAFEYAVKKGYGIELDVQLSKDKVPVVFHDMSLQRICGKEGNVKDYTWEELQFFALCESGERIPRLEDVLKLVDGKVPLIIEIKCRDNNIAVCSYTYQLLKDYEGDFCVESFHPLVLHWFRKKTPELVRGQLVPGIAKEDNNSVVVWFATHLLFNFISKPDFIACDYRQKGGLSQKICSESYRTLFVAWTLKSQEDMEMLRGKFELFIFEGFEAK